MEGSMKRMIVETEVIAGVPLITWAQEDATHCPLVIYIHGLGGDKRGGMELGYNLTSRGFFFVSLDAEMHGERLDDRIAHTWDRPLPGAIFPFETGLDRYYLMCEIVDKTARDITRLIDHYSNDPRIDKNRIGVAGASMGGFIAYRTAAIEARIQALAALISFPAIAQRWQDMVIEATFKADWTAESKNVELETKKRYQYIKDLDPIEGLIKFAPKPLLMICGELDTDTPKHYSLQAYETLAPFYREQPERLQIKIHDRGIHRVSSEMIADTAAWFDRYLNDPGLSG
jgi:cephalosporin-C deacetylase-like acetyl esterase